MIKLLRKNLAACLLALLTLSVFTTSVDAACARVGTANTTGPATIGAQVSDTNITTVASDFAIANAGTYNGATGQHPTGFTLDGQASTFIISTDNSTSAQMTSLYYVKGYSVGANKVIAYTNPSAQSSGVGIVVTFYSGCDITSDTTSLIRSSAKNSNGGDTSTTSSLTAIAGDLAVAGFASDVATATPSPGSVVASNAATGTQTGIIEYSPSGNTTMAITVVGGSPSIAAIIMKAAGGGGGSAAAARALHQFNQQILVH